MKKIGKNIIALIFLLTAFFITPSCVLLYIPDNATNGTESNTGPGGKVQGTEDQINQGTTTGSSSSGTGTSTDTDKKKEDLKNGGKQK